VGSRLRPIISDRPKVLAPVGGRPYVTYLLDQLAEAAVRDVVLLTGYRADQVQRSLGRTYRGLPLTYSPEPAALGTAGPLRYALSYLSSDFVLLINGDSYCDVDWQAVGRFHRQQSADFSMVLARVPDAGRFGRVCARPDSRVTGFTEKSAVSGAGWINAGIYLLARGLIGEIPPGRPVSLEREMLPAWIGAGRRVYGFRSAGGFLDIGTPESYARAETFFAGEGRAKPQAAKTGG
jgi:NDP-sugar pyrophosphorylase family protein